MAWQIFQTRCPVYEMVKVFKRVFFSMYSGIQGIYFIIQVAACTATVRDHILHVDAMGSF